MKMNLFNVGKIVNTHGIKGELKVLTTSDFAELRLKKGNHVIACSPDGKQQKTLRIVSTRMHKNMYLLTVEGIDSLTAAESFKQWELKIEQSQLHRLPEGEYYFHEIIGCKVVTDQGRLLGEIRSILTPGANHVWVVPLGPKKELLLPVIDDVILNVDVQAKMVTVHLLEGLMPDEN